MQTIVQRQIVQGSPDGMLHLGVHIIHGYVPGLKHSTGRKRHAYNESISYQTFDESMIALHQDRKLRLAHYARHGENPPWFRVLSARDFNHPDYLKLPVMEHDDLWAFYEYIKWDHKRKRFMVSVKT